MALMDITYLAALQPGQVGIISEIQAELGLQQRLSALGFRVGRQITLVRRAWFAGPLHVRIGTTEIMLRRRDAIAVAIKSIPQI
jgi:ferrous iron transport protein A